MKAGKCMQLESKVALVTGAGSGIGYGAAKRLAEEGAFVYLTGRRLEPLARAAEIIGPRARAAQADVTSKEDMVRVADLVREEQGGLDIIFANAGGGHTIALEDITAEDFDRQFGVN